MKKNNRGFTLLELLAALVLSSIIILGAYGMFTSVLKTREASLKKNELNTLLISVRQLVKDDLLQLFADSVSIDNSGDNAVAVFKSHNSIKLEKSVPVNIKYYVDDEGWLIREESLDSLGYVWQMRLLDKVKDFTVMSHNGYRFTEDYDKSDTILQFTFSRDSVPFNFIAGCGITSEPIKKTGTGIDE